MIGRRPVPHPLLIEWMCEFDKEELLIKLKRAEEVVGQHGSITITYRDGKAQKVEAIRKENI